MVEHQTTDVFKAKANDGETITIIENKEVIRTRGLDGKEQIARGGKLRTYTTSDSRDVKAIDPGAGVFEVTDTGKTYRKID